MAKPDAETCSGCVSLSVGLGSCSDDRCVSLCSSATIRFFFLLSFPNHELHGNAYRCPSGQFTSILSRYHAVSDAERPRFPGSCSITIRFSLPRDLL